MAIAYNSEGPKLMGLPEIKESAGNPYDKVYSANAVAIAMIAAALLLGIISLFGV
jgi:hypothetical protein